VKSVTYRPIVRLHRLDDEPMAVALPARHRLARSPSLELRVLAQEPFILFRPAGGLSPDPPARRARAVKKFFAMRSSSEEQARSATRTHQFIIMRRLECR
jgi:hypothetical protein